MKQLLLFILSGFFLFSCYTSEQTKSIYNPAAEGFNMQESDASAIAFADSVVVAHGGRKAWDDITYLKWNFFGARRHVWNKKTGDIIIEGLRDPFTINMNLESEIGDVYLGDRQLTDQDSIANFLQRGKEMWINDAYWLILPFKLKDSGVTLKKTTGFPIGHDSLGRLEQLILTFNDVGVTPENKYVVTFEGESKKIHQWDFYDKATDTFPNFSNPWRDYKQYGDILLSSNRGRGNLSEISVSDTLSKYFE